MAKWSGSQFGKPGANVKGTDFTRTTTSSDTASTSKSGGVSGMANSLGTQSGQTNMGNSRSTK